jgi:hypothetical protein
MVRDARITSQQYLQFIINNLPNELSDTIVEEQLGYLHACLTQYTPEKYRTSLFSQLFNFTKTYLSQISNSQ